MPFRKRINKIGKLVLLSILAVVGGCASNIAPPMPEAAQSDFSDEYLIGVGDSLRVDVWRHADLSLTVPVRPDGKISIPLVGDISVGEKTPEQVALNVKKSLSEFVRNPVVTIIVLEIGSSQFRSRIRVTGAVDRPLSTPYQPGMTVLDIVLEAGGATEFASLGRAALYRADGQRFKINLRGILSGGDLSTNYSLIPGDVVTVPERTF